MRAWRSLERFEGRASLRTWLHRIATNVCLDTLSSASRRARPVEEGPAGSVDSILETRERAHWLEPIAESRVIPADADPYEVVALRQSIRLAFVAALQHLPPRQRAALLLAEVLGWSAAEAADALEVSVAAVNSALQRARATLANRNIMVSAGALTVEQSALVERYVEAFRRYDVDELVLLLREDATLSMPPYTLWLQGREAIAAWLRGPGAACEGSHVIPVAASGLPAFAQYRRSGTPGIVGAWALIVLEVSGDAISSWNAFLDVETIFPMFGLPQRLEVGGKGTEPPMISA